MFGMDLVSYGQGHGFLAVGLTGTRLLRLSRARLEASSAGQIKVWSRKVLTAGTLEGVIGRE